MPINPKEVTKLAIAITKKVHHDYVSVEKFKMRSMCFSFASVLSDQITDNGCAFGPRKASKVGKPSSRGVSYLHRVVPIASTSSLAHALALSAHMYVCLLL